MAVEKDPLVEKLAATLGAVADLVIVYGFADEDVDDSDPKKTVNIYLDPYMSEYVTIEVGKIKHQKKLDPPAIGGSYFWIETDAEVTYGSSGKTTKIKAGLVGSALRQDNSGTAISLAPGKTAGARRGNPKAFCGYPEGTEWYTTEQGSSCPWTICCGGPG